LFDKRVIVPDYIIGPVCAVINAIDGPRIKVLSEQIRVEVFITGVDKPLSVWNFD
jgi:hypothetical protein